VDGVAVSPEPLLVVAGPTGSGKSHLGLEAAEALGGEVVSADAFAVYRGLDIGTDKPDAEARRRVPHHLVDVIDPTTRFSAGDYAAAADAVIAEIRARGRTPIVVGGSHFYLRALVLGLFPAPPADAAIRARLAAEWRADPLALHARLRAIDPESAERIPVADRQRVIRAMEVFEATGKALSEAWRATRRTPRYRALFVAPNRARRELYVRIDTRVERMFAGGLVEEVRQLLEQGVPRDAHAFKAIGYRDVISFIDGRCDLSTAIAATKRLSRNLAKRQLSWLRHLDEGTLQWVAPAEQGGVTELVARWRGHWNGSGES
jgi:tRNA dimethylallyltransferase